ncbi:hypothetical protein [Comamonas terrae]|uniref:Uncharacterized protein n=1 Tax=Comamonas terrae TaxID=673548 RepID=A0ABW5UPY7_9BURK|nr:hypothetical protein [Comamonas terrae]
MCQCRQDIEQKLTEHYAAKLPHSREVDAKLTGYAITLGTGLGIKPYMAAEIRHTVTIKKTGADKRKTEKVNMYFSHCPFCGEKLEKS